MTGSLATLTALLGIAHLTVAPWAPAWLHRNGGLILAAAMILLPLLPAMIGRGQPGYRLVLPPLWKELWPGLLAALVLLPAFHALVLLGWIPLPSHTLHLTVGKAPWFALLHLVNVVLPEELFFRAYLQPRLASEGGPTGLGIHWHRGVFLQALAFGFLHVVSYGMDWRAMDRVLPGLAFGYLRQRTGAVWSSALFHLACNLYLFLQ